MKIHILFFAKLKDLAGTSAIVLDVADGSSIRDLRELLASRYPMLSPTLNNIIFAINHQFAFDQDLLLPDAEIAIFPPVSGGSGKTIVDISEEPIDLNRLLSLVTDKTTGAAAIFSGIIRGETQSSVPYETVGLEYEAYKPMAIVKLQQISEEIRTEYPDVENLVLIQRIGYMDAGTPTVVVICTSAHRDSGIFAAAKYGIDRIKEIVPVWKKEIGPNGDTWVEGHYMPKENE